MAFTIFGKVLLFFLKVVAVGRVKTAVSKRSAGVGTVGVGGVVGQRRGSIARVEEGISLGLTLGNVDCACRGGNILALGSIVLRLHSIISVGLETKAIGVEAVGIGKRGSGIAISVGGSRVEEGISLGLGLTLEDASYVGVV